MSNKPKAYMFCDAGCKWEGVHKEDFEKSAAYIPVTDSGVVGCYNLSVGKEYKIFAPKDAENNFTCVLQYWYTESGASVIHPITWTNADKYAESFVFRMLEVVYDPDNATEITLVYEIAGKRYTETITGTALSLRANGYLQVISATKVLIFNAEAEVVCRGEQGEKGDKGEQGVSITNIYMYQTTSGATGVDYAMDITLSNGERISHQFTVERSNGKDGTNGRDGTVTYTAIIEYVIADNPQQGVDYYYDSESFADPMAIKVNDLLVDTNGNVFSVRNNQTYICRYAGFSMKGETGGSGGAKVFYYTPTTGQTPAYGGRYWVMPHIKDIAKIKLIRCTYPYAIPNGNSFPQISSIAPDKVIYENGNYTKDYTSDYGDGFNLSILLSDNDYNEVEGILTVLYDGNMGLTLTNYEHSEPLFNKNGHDIVLDFNEINFVFEITLK